LGEDATSLTEEKLVPKPTPRWFGGDAEEQDDSSDTIGPSGGEELARVPYMKARSVFDALATVVTDLHCPDDDDEDEDGVGAGVPAAGCAAASLISRARFSSCCSASAFIKSSVMLRFPTFTPRMGDAEVDPESDSDPDLLGLVPGVFGSPSCSFSASSLCVSEPRAGSEETIVNGSMLFAPAKAGSEDEAPRFAEMAVGAATRGNGFVPEAQSVPQDEQDSSPELIGLKSRAAQVVTAPASEESSAGGPPRGQANRAAAGDGGSVRTSGHAESSQMEASDVLAP